MAFQIAPKKATLPKIFGHYKLFLMKQIWKGTQRWMGREDRINIVKVGGGKIKII